MKIFDANELFCDGGVIGRNPSALGGTWAYRLVKNGVVVAEKSGVVTVKESYTITVSNNMTEMLALIHGLEDLPLDWKGCVLSDSQITLGRAFEYWKWNNIPIIVQERFRAAKARQRRSTYWTHILLQGHPTKKELETGVGSKGYPVSEHNKWCDEACGRESKNFMASLTKMFTKEVEEKKDE